MRLLPILSAIAMATTTAAAQPRQDNTSSRVRYVAPEVNPRLPLDEHWTELAFPTSVKHGTEHITVGADAGRFSQLRIDAYAGTVILLRLRVFGQDGTVQTVQLGRMLDRAHRSVVIDLFAGKAIDQIAITTETRTQGRYRVYGSDATRVAAR
jgi:hypothetical protein